MISERLHCHQVRYSLDLDARPAANLPGGEVWWGIAAVIIAEMPASIKMHLGMALSAPRAVDPPRLPPV